MTAPASTELLSNGLPSCIRPGEILGGKYRLERELGRGAMGTVWAAMHLTLGQRVAIKLIAAEHAQSPEARARFSIEAKAAVRLRSRHVVQVFDDGETPQGTPYIVMELLEGESLESRLDREGTIPLLDAVRITGQVARALSRAHAQGIVHRDLKPGNIFLARSDEDELGWLAKVLDFGIAKVEEHRDQSTTKTGTVLGTPLFMSPEQVRGASTVDHRADLYSLGMCFYNMVTGKYAFDGESFGAILVAICTEPLPNLRSFAPSASEEVARWFERCCAREASARFQSADELMQHLQAAVGSPAQVLNRASAPDDQIGPSGTIKGHSPPISPHTRPLGTEDTGGLAVRPGGAVGEPMQSAPARTALVENAARHPGVTSESSTVLTVPGLAPEPPRKKRSSLPLLAVAVLALAAGGVVLLRGQGSRGPLDSQTTDTNTPAGTAEAKLPADPGRQPTAAAPSPAPAEVSTVSDPRGAPSAAPVEPAAPAGSAASAAAALVSAPAEPAPAGSAALGSPAPSPALAPVAARPKPAAAPRPPSRPAPASKPAAPVIDVGF